MSAGVDTAVEIRLEHDLLGGLAVAASALYGVHTARAVANFDITGDTLERYPLLIESLAAVKQAAAVANRRCGRLDPTIAAAIAGACEQVRRGEHHDQFVVDPLQGGAGTSTNMNANEVIANLALERLGRERGAYDVVHPLEHVNLGQSTNDVYPTAVKLALHRAAGDLLESLELAQGTFAAKAEDFSTIVKLGRTQLQDAVPMTLGQEFRVFAGMLAKEEAALADARQQLCELNLGGTAIGTTLNAHPEFRDHALAELRSITGIPGLCSAADLVEATQDTGAYVHLSGVMRKTAIKLSKICNDLRLLTSGPRAGLHEISLPAVQAGSSMMPGKVNPVIPELVNQVAFEVIGNDLTVTLAAEAGQLQLNAFGPVITRSLLDSAAHLAAAARALAQRCVAGITANREHLANLLPDSLVTVTHLSPVLGYAQASRLAAEAGSGSGRLLELAVSKGLLDDVQVRQIEDEARMAAR
ncbi:aspartate ammonia-lyase [Promicromonospora panici]|uniref:aspartate ammonia-lyase n=1 Tax=Promicromonospora panici TaxID=2219658 RepID=UPI00101D9B14|nr:aspartate ammonia-lyase [Promicromonospora panici]